MAHELRIGSGFAASTKEEDRYRKKDLLWKEFFRDSSKWWDNRNSKLNPRFPDFKHKDTKEPLWIHGWDNPSWVAHELRSRGWIVGHPCSPLPDAPSLADAFVALLRACSKTKDLIRGTIIHDDLLQRGLLHQCSDALVTMYAKCGAIAKAQLLLNMHKSRDVITWTALISGYAREGRGQNALDCFEQMQHEGIRPDAFTYACILKACATIGAVDKGKQIHDEILRQGLLQDSIVLGGALVDMYAKCGALLRAQRVLEELPSRDVVSWSALIAGFAHEGQSEQALNCYECMQREGILPTAMTYASILKACAGIGAVDKGKQIHDEIARQGLLQNNIVLGGALVDMYAKCGALSKAQCVLEGLPFRNVVAWNALITGYAQKGQGGGALKCFEQMQHETIPPDSVTYISILKACATIGALEKGRQIHDEIAQQGLLQNDVAVGNALVDMYAKCGALSKAQSVIEEIPSRDVISWNALIAGYAQEGQCEQVLNCFERMQREGILPDAVTYACILRACARIGEINKGKQIHDKIARQGLLQNNSLLGGALVDMYVKCGDLLKARSVIEELSSRDVVSWNALIAGYAQEGQGEQALNCFEQMLSEGILPNAVTFSCVLNVCSHDGLIEEGQNLFLSMGTKYGVKPNLECCTCMIDLFGRAGHLEKAVQLIQEMPSSDHSSIWLALLGACRKWGDVNIGRWAFEQAVQLDKSDGSAYILMANIYAAAGMQQKAENVEATRIGNKAWKKTGQSQWIDSSNAVHAFSVGDTTKQMCLWEAS